MIYGLRFNGTHIPDNVRRRFSQRKNFPSVEEFGDRQGMRLHGVCNTASESGQMFIKATEANRPVNIVGPRRIGDETWYGVYVS